MLPQRNLVMLNTYKTTQKTREPPEFPFILLITKCSHVVVGFDTSCGTIPYGCCNLAKVFLADIPNGKDTRNTCRHLIICNYPTILVSDVETCQVILNRIKSHINKDTAKFVVSHLTSFDILAINTANLDIITFDFFND